ncbi:MAG: T9SS type A sorting domain-containing protein [Ignavibacteria bacterium]|nr:T9SS type A sorting domain-containing protein [Ignavibacteria bacterium]
MKLFKIILLLTLCSSNLFSQSGWIHQNSGITTKLNSVKFINSNTGICVGNYGVILRTTNGGVNWTQKSIVYENNLKSLAITSANIGYTVGDSGLALKSTDGGITWTRMSLVKPYYFFSSVFFVNDSIGYTGGVEYHDMKFNKIFKTTNNGSSWDSVEVNGSAFSYVKSLFFINSSLGWLTGGIPLLSTEYVSRTVNGGLNWSIQYNRQPPFNTVYFIDSLNGWLSGQSSAAAPTILRTTNSGDNWISEFPGTGYIINSIYFTDKRNGWAAGENRIIQSTTNGGINWINQTATQPGINYNSVYFTDSLTGWAVGDSGTILKTTTGGVLTNFTNTSSEIPDKYFLSQNYPNPFNPVTHLEFGIPELEFVSLKIFDVLGNEVSTLVNESKPAGRYEVTFNASNARQGSDLPSGIYFYSLLIDGNTMDTKRMVLLK